MVKYFENNTNFYYTWEQVVQGFWKRYPNPESTHVLSEDIVDQKIQDNKLFTKRVLTKTNPVPKWGERFFKSGSVKIIEESICDPKEKTFITCTRNIGYTSVMNVVEKVVYKVSDENSNWTVAKRSVWVDSKIRGFSMAIQKFGVERYKKNSIKMINGYNYILNCMFPKFATTSNSFNINASNQNFVMKSEKIKEKAKQVTSDIASKSSTLLKAPNPS